MAKVVVKQRGVPPVTYDLEQTETVVGRSAEADILLPHNSVSRKQATIVEDSRGYSIDDSGSRNGMLVNGKLVTEHRLQDGDTIEVGLFRITFQGDRPIADARLAAKLALDNQNSMSFESIEEQATRMVRRGPDGKPIIPTRPRSKNEFGREGIITGGIGLPVAEDSHGNARVPRSPAPPTLNQKPKNVQVATEEIVERILSSVGLGEFASVFAMNEITGDILADLTETDLRDLGIDKLGARKRLMRAIKSFISME